METVKISLQRYEEMRENNSRQSQKGKLAIDAISEIMEISKEFSKSNGSSGKKEMDKIEYILSEVEDKAILIE